MKATNKKNIQRLNEEKLRRIIRKMIKEDLQRVNQDARASIDQNPLQQAMDYTSSMNRTNVKPKNQLTSLPNEFIEDWGDNIKLMHIDTETLLNFNRCLKWIDDFNYKLYNNYGFNNIDPNSLGKILDMMYNLVKVDILPETYKMYTDTEHFYASNGSNVQNLAEGMIDVQEGDITVRELASKYIVPAKDAVRKLINKMSGNPEILKRGKYLYNILNTCIKYLEKNNNYRFL